MRQVEVVIVGGGISGLSALHFLRQLKPELSVALYEKADRLGGTIGTDHIDGYSLDWGPNGFLDREELTLRLADELGLADKLERAGANVTNRYILRGGKLRPVPMSPPKFMMSNILSWRGKLRLLFEPFARPRPEGIDESIYDFVKRRIGTEAADYLVQPMVSGVYGGVASRLSLKSCFPVMREMEDEYGGLFKAMIAKARIAKAKRKAQKQTGSPAGPGGWLTSFEGGLSVIIDRFEERYAEHIALGTGVSKITQGESCALVELSNGEVVSARHLILSLPAYQAAVITKELSATLSNCLAQIEYAPISVVCLGYDASQVGLALDGFGFLVPAKEKKRILGSIWTSSIFANRAPDGCVQLRCMVGGDGDHESAALSEVELVTLVRSDLDEIMKITGEPKLTKVYRWAQGIPQFKVGHSDIMADIEQELDRLGNLHLTGNAYYGIGLNDCVKQSYKIVNSL